MVRLLRPRPRPTTFAEYMALPENRARRDAMIALCDAMLERNHAEAERRIALLRAMEDPSDRDHA